MSFKEITIIGGILFSFGLVAFIAFFATKTMVTQMVAIPEINKYPIVNSTLTSTISNVGKSDYLMMGLMIGLALFIIFSGYLSTFNTAFMVIYFIVMIIVVAMTPILSNIWEDVTSMSVFGTTVTSFPITNHILLNLPIYVTIIGFFGMIAMVIGKNNI